LTRSRIYLAGAIWRISRQQTSDLIVAVSGKRHEVVARRQPR
jgi:hypothetical protein